MDCYNGTCRNACLDQFTCDNCYVPHYCSAECKQRDTKPHETWCRPRLYSLKDFVPVKTSKKVLEIGTYGEIQLMQHVGTHKLYAIKIIRKALVANVIPLKVLLREVMIHKTLIHPNIVRLVDHFEDTQKLYFVLEFVEKGSLFDLIRRKIKLSESEACEIFIQACVGLHYLHSNNVLHRDIKPENLLISKDEVLKICDFGWSAQGNEKRVTFCGTLDYMSPEMINSEPHTFKVDIWAIGILLYEMLHGSPPFRAKNPKEQYRNIASSNYPMGTHVSKPAAQLIRSILQLKPENRPSIIEILKSQWVKEYSESKLQKDWKVQDPVYGQGVISAVIGKVANVSFGSTVIPMVEAEIFRKSNIFDRYGTMLYEAPEEETLPPRFDPQNSQIRPDSLYKNLGIDSGRATPINSTNSGRNSRTGSRRGSLMGNAASTPALKIANKLNLEVSPPSRPKIPKSPKTFEEVKRSQPLPSRTQRKMDFEDINLRPEAIPAVPVQKSRPKSTFLSKFSKGLITNK